MKTQTLIAAAISAALLLAPIKAQTEEPLAKVLGAAGLCEDAAVMILAT